MYVIYLNENYHIISQQLLEWLGAFGWEPNYSYTLIPGTERE